MPICILIRYRTAKSTVVWIYNIKSIRSASEVCIPCLSWFSVLYFNAQKRDPLSWMSVAEAVVGESGYGLLTEKIADRTQSQGHRYGQRISSLRRRWYRFGASYDPEVQYYEHEPDVPVHLLTALPESCPQIAGTNDNFYPIGMLMDVLIKI